MISGSLFTSSWIFFSHFLIFLNCMFECHFINMNWSFDLNWNKKICIPYIFSIELDPDWSAWNDTSCHWRPAPRHRNADQSHASRIYHQGQLSYPSRVPRQHRSCKLRCFKNSKGGRPPRYKTCPKVYF